MAHSGSLNYYDLKKFCELTTLGKLTPMHQVELPNISGDQIYKIPYNSHLTYLCNKHDENVLSLCSMLMNQINQDMVSRLELSPIFRGITGKGVENLIASAKDKGSIFVLVILFSFKLIKI